MKKNLIIINPCSGKKRANKYLTAIVDVFTKKQYVCQVMTTTQRGDGAAYASAYAADFDLITCIGGDGSFNEVVSGLLESGHNTPVGYIPAGSTNDFATSLGLSMNIVGAARDIVNGEKRPLDIGSFNGRKFSYVASFGAFTEASYATPQNVKNTLGHMAYLIEGVSSLASIKKEHMQIEADGLIYDGDYIFGAVSNSTSLAGILTLDSAYVDMNDGLFELLLVKAPKNAIELTKIATALTTRNYDSDMLIFVKAKNFHIRASAEIPWSLDGEFQEGCEDIHIENLPSAIDIVMKK